MRLDVCITGAEIEADLAAVQLRMSTGRYPLESLPTMAIDFPGVEFRVRELGTEQRIFSLDAATGRLIGYSVFDILPEGGRSFHGSVRSPHSRYAPQYQGRGIATAVYSWMLAQGRILVSGARQSAGAYALWRSLGRRIVLELVRVRRNEISPVAIGEDDPRFFELDVRLRLGQSADAMRG